MMEKSLEMKFPLECYRRAQRGKKYFWENGTLLWPVNASSDESVRAVKNQKTLS